MHLTVPEIKDSIDQFRPEEPGRDMLQVPVIHVVEHQPQILGKRIGLDFLIVFHQTERSWKFTGSEIRLMVALP